MRSIVSTLILLSLSAPAFARDLPEPEALGLVAVGVIAAIVALRRKRK